jgi:cytochrome subunit of sulfide dehydrogenase
MCCGAQKIGKCIAEFLHRHGYIFLPEFIRCLTKIRGGGLMRKHLAAAALAGSALLGVTAPVQAQDMNKVRYLAATCANCHGTDGRSVGIMESLAGYDKEKFITNMKEYRSGDKPATIMHQLVKGYTDKQIADLAAYFAAQPKKK